METYASKYILLLIKILPASQNAVHKTVHGPNKF